MHFDSASSDEGILDDEVDSNIWIAIESDSDGEFLEGHGIVEQIMPTSEHGTINPIDFYRHFITDEIINLVVRETNRYAEQYLRIHQPSKRSKKLQWEPTTNEEMLKFLRIIIEMGLVQILKIDYYWSKSQLHGSKSIQNTRSRENLNCSSSFYIFRTMMNRMRVKID